MSVSAAERARLDALVARNIAARGPVRRPAGGASDVRGRRPSDVRGRTVQEKLADDYAAGRGVAGEALERLRNKQTNKHEKLEAARALVDALPLSLERLATLPAKQRRARAGATLAETGRAVKAALERGDVGHRARMGNRASYVQQEDLDGLLPDGWGKRFGLESKHLAFAAGVPPMAVPLLVLMTFVSEVCPSESGRQLGAGGQFSIAWLAAKLGCTTAWVKVLCNRLDPHAEWRREVAALRRRNRKRQARGKAALREPPKPGGRVLLRRFRRLVPYATTPQRGTAPQAAWVDAQGIPRTWVDVRGVCYSTDAGRALLVRYTLKGKGRGVVRAHVALLTELRTKGFPTRWKVAARLEVLAGKNAVFRDRGPGP